MIAIAFFLNKEIIFIYDKMQFGATFSNACAISDHVDGYLTIPRFELITNNGRSDMRLCGSGSKSKSKLSSRWRKRQRVRAMDDTRSTKKYNN